VARLVAEGLSNPAVAEKLLVSRGTVKVHLSHIFTKLGIRSRAELAAEAARRGGKSVADLVVSSAGSEHLEEDPQRQLCVRTAHRSAVWRT
jgi:transposase